MQKFFMCLFCVSAQKESFEHNLQNWTKKVGHGYPALAPPTLKWDMSHFCPLFFWDGPLLYEYYKKME